MPGWSDVVSDVCLKSREQMCECADTPVRARTRPAVSIIILGPPGWAAASSAITRGPRFRHHGADFSTKSERCKIPIVRFGPAFFFSLQKGSHPNSAEQQSQRAKAPKAKQADKKTPTSAALSCGHIFTPTPSPLQGRRPREHVRHSPAPADAQAGGAGVRRAGKRPGVWSWAFFPGLIPVCLGRCAGSCNAEQIRSCYSNTSRVDRNVGEGSGRRI